MKPYQKAMIQKDVKEIIGNKMILIPMLIVPLIFVFIFPVALFAFAGEASMNMSDMQPLIDLVEQNQTFENNTQMLISISINYMFPSFFLLIPVMTSSILAASSFVGEKERKTLETLLYTPMDISELFISKVLATLIPAYVITFVSFIIFGIVANVGGWIYFNELIFPNLKWIITVFWISPAITLLGIVFMVIISSRVNTFQEAQQLGALIVLPVIAVVIGQSSGMFLLNELSLLAMGLVIMILNYFLFKLATSRFSVERLIK
jgi:ABC-2 type transport system permease protein